MTAQDYCTLADVEAYAGVNFSDGIGPTDVEIGTMITQASRLMDAYGGVQFSGTETHTHYFDSTYGLSFLILPQRPIVSITSMATVASNGVETALTEGYVRNDNDFWIDDSDAGVVRFHYAFTENVSARIKVVWTAGATTPPADVKMATILHVVRSAGRAAMNDENCMERVKEFWINLIKATDAEYQEMLDRVKKRSQMAVATFGSMSQPTSLKGLWF
jgi:hypothetical protein